MAGGVGGSEESESGTGKAGDPRNILGEREYEALRRWRGAHPQRQN